MELPIVSGILRRSPEMGRHSQQYEENCQSSPPFQDKGSVRFVDEKMNTKLLGTPVEKVRFSYDRYEGENINEDDDEDYSASVSAILQRRASSRRGKRRSSSPFSHEDFSTQSTPRRRSSAFTTTSDTAISIEDVGIKEEQIFENIRLHKEVIANVKHQPWTVRRKLKLIQQAKSYVKRHEGELQVRLKQSRSTKDIWTRFSIVLVKKWNHTKREIINFMNLLIPWELRIKEIESHFGTVVASYFTFLRWLFWVNLVTSIILTAFVIVPEILHNGNKRDLSLRKQPPPDERKITLDVLLNFEGLLKYSPIFYGYYSDHEEDGKYKIPTAYFMIGVGVYIYSFIATLRKMAVNFRLSKLSEKEDECIFTWKLFTGWDYMIGNAETGHNRTSSIVLGFKEALLEEAEKKKEKRSWKIITVRIFVNLNVIWMLIFSARAVIYVVNKTGDRVENADEWTDKNLPFIVKWWYQNETTVVMTVIGSVFPFIFELFGFIEKYHPRKTLRIQLARIMALNLLNLYTLTFALFNQIDGMTKELDGIKGNITYTINTSVILTPLTTTQTSSASTDSSFNFPINIFRPVYDYNFRDAEPHFLKKRESPNSGFENSKATTSLTDLFYKQQADFTDPATGKYYKPIPTSESSENIKIEILNMTKNKNLTSTSTGVTSYSTTTQLMDYLTNFTDLQSAETKVTTDEPDINNVRWITDVDNSSSTVNSSEYFIVTEMSETWFEEPNVTINSSSNVIVTSSFEYWTTQSPMTTTNVGINSSLLTDKLHSGVPKTTAVVHLDVSKSSQASDVISPASPTLITPVTINSCSRPGDENIKLRLIKASTLLSKTDNSTQHRLRRLCWETMFGQELVKLTVLDLGANFLSTFGGDFIRALLVRYMNKFWCWDLEKKFPKYADFKIAENILHLVNNQGMVWMGMFFSPGLPLINVAKLMIMMYLRSWAVLTCNVPHEVVFRASRSNNFYFALLLTMLFLCVLPVCYAIVWLKPSWHCGPFSNYGKIYLIFAATLRDLLPKNFHKFMEYMATPGTVIPLIVILLLVIYYLASLTSALREANIDLKIQLRRERTEERKKMFQMASRRKRGGSDLDSTFTKWKKILQEAPSMKMSEDSPYSDFVYDNIKDDTDDKQDEDAEKIRKFLKLSQKRELSPADQKWETLIKMIPKSSGESKVKDNSSTTSSVKDDSSALSENIPEIKISRVPTMDAILKPDSKPLQQKTSKSDKDREQSAIFQKCYQKQKEKKLSEQTADSDYEHGADIDLDDVFLANVIVEIPELPTIQESISNRIKRRLRKVISMGSRGETETSSGTNKKSENPNKETIDSLETVRLREALTKNLQSRLLKSGSWSTAQGEEFKLRLQERRRSSLSDLDNLRQNDDDN